MRFCILLAVFTVVSYCFDPAYPRASGLRSNERKEIRRAQPSSFRDKDNTYPQAHSLKKTGMPPPSHIQSSPQMSHAQQRPMMVKGAQPMGIQGMMPMPSLLNPFGLPMVPMGGIPMMVPRPMAGGVPMVQGQHSGMGLNGMTSLGQHPMMGHLGQLPMPGQSQPQHLFPSLFPIPQQNDTGASPPAVTMHPLLTLPTVSLPSLPTLPPLTMPPSFQRMMGITQAPTKPKELEGEDLSKSSVRRSPSSRESSLHSISSRLPKFIRSDDDMVQPEHKADWIVPF